MYAPAILNLHTLILLFKHFKRIRNAQFTFKKKKCPVFVIYFFLEGYLNVKACFDKYNLPFIQQKTKKLIFTIIFIWQSHDLVLKFCSMSTFHFRTFKIYFFVFKLLKWDQISSIIRIKLYSNIELWYIWSHFLKDETWKSYFWKFEDKMLTLTKIRRSNCDLCHIYLHFPLPIDLIKDIFPTFDECFIGDFIFKSLLV